MAAAANEEDRGLADAIHDDVCASLQLVERKDLEGDDIELIARLARDLRAALERAV